MNDRDRELLKSRLRVLATSKGIRIDTPYHWVVFGIANPRLFLQHLSLLMEPDSVIYIEGTSISPEAASFYARHEAPHPVPIACDTVFPVPDIYHLRFSTETILGIVDLATGRPINQLFNHLKGYHSAEVIFEFHDAFHGPLSIRGSVDEQTVKTLSRELGVRYSKEPTYHQASRSMSSFLDAMEHAERVQRSPVRWWRRIANEFMAGFREK